MEESRNALRLSASVRPTEYGSDSLFERVREIIVAESAAERPEVVPEARLLHDLGIFGDVAESVLLRFADELRVDLRSLEFPRYFYDEPHLFDFKPYWWAMLNRKRAPKDPLTVADLVAAAERGSWARGETTSVRERSNKPLQPTSAAKIEVE